MAALKQDIRDYYFSGTDAWSALRYRVREAVQGLPDVRPHYARLDDALRLLPASSWGHALAENREHLLSVVQADEFLGLARMEFLERCGKMARAVGDGDLAAYAVSAYVSEALRMTSVEPGAEQNGLGLLGMLRDDASISREARAHVALTMSRSALAHGDIVGCAIGARRARQLGPTPGTLASCQTLLGDVDLAQGLYLTGLNRYRKALQGYGGIPAAKAAARPLQGAALASARCGDFEGALRYLEDLTRSDGDVLAEGYSSRILIELETISGIGRAVSKLGQLRALLTRVLARRDLCCSISLSVARAHIERGECAASGEELEAARALARQYGNPVSMCDVLLLSARRRWLQGNLQETGDVAAELLELAQGQRLWEHREWARLLQAKVAFYRGDLRGAGRLGLRALRLFGRTQSVKDFAEAVRIVSATMVRAAKADRALNLLERSYGLQQVLLDPVSISTDAAILSSLYAHAGCEDKAERMHDHARRALEYIESPFPNLLFSVLKTERVLSRGDWNAATGCAEEAMSQSEGLELGALQAMPHYQLVCAHALAGDTTKANQTLEASRNRFPHLEQIMWSEAASVARTATGSRQHVLPIAAFVY